MVWGLREPTDSGFSHIGSRLGSRRSRIRNNVSNKVVPLSISLLSVICCWAPAGAETLELDSISDVCPKYDVPDAGIVVGRNEDGKIRYLRYPATRIRRDTDRYDIPIFLNKRTSLSVWPAEAYSETSRTKLFHQDFYFEENKYVINLTDYLEASTRMGMAVRVKREFQEEVFQGYVHAKCSNALAPYYRDIPENKFCSFERIFEVGLRVNYNFHTSEWPFSTWPQMNREIASFIESELKCGDPLEVK